MKRCIILHLVWVSTGRAFNLQAIGIRWVHLFLWLVCLTFIQSCYYFRCYSASVRHQIIEESDWCGTSDVSKRALHIARRRVKKNYLYDLEELYDLEKFYICFRHCNSWLSTSWLYTIGRDNIFSFFQKNLLTNSNLAEHTTYQLSGRQSCNLHGN